MGSSVTVGFSTRIVARFSEPVNSVLSHLQAKYSCRTNVCHVMRDRPPIRYIDVVFTDVAAHYFQNELANSILFGVEEEDLASIYENDRELFERLKNYGWPPYKYTTGDELIATLKAEHVKAFGISASYGLNGWVWAKKMAKIQRDSRKEFT